MARLRDDSAVRQSQFQELRDIRENLNYSETETNGLEILGRLEALFVIWTGYLPNLREIFGQKAVEHLLFVSVKNAHANKSSEGKSFVNFVVSSGYKDEPDVDENGKPVSRRDTPIHEAARLKCKTIIVRQLFDIYDKFEVNYVDESGLSHFHVACEYGLEDAVENFLEHGHDPKCVAPGTGDSTLHMAMRFSVDINNYDYCRRKGTVELLLRGGADPNLANEKGETPLHFIAQRDFQCDTSGLFFRINEELKQVVRIDARDKLGNTPLHVALKSHRNEVVQLLLWRGADPSLVNEKGETPLHLICEKDSDGSLTELFFDILENLGKTVEIDARNRWNETPLKLALRHKKKKIVESLLRCGANPNQVNEWNSTFLHEFCSTGQIDLAEIFFKIDGENRRPVLVDYLDSEGNSPLHLALKYERKEAVELLLRNAADPNLRRSVDGFTPLHIICKKKDDDLLKIFFDISDANDRKVDIDAQDNDGNTALFLALRSNFYKAAEVLVRRGADLTIANQKDETPWYLACLSYNSADVATSVLDILDEIQQTERINGQDRLGDTPLHLCMRLRNRWAAELLLKRGADPTLLNEKGETPLHVMSKNSQGEFPVELFFRVLDERGLRTEYIDRRDKLGCTALHWALRCGHVCLTRILLRRGADPNAVNLDGETPLHYICQYSGTSLLESFYDVVDDLGKTVEIDPRNKFGLTPLRLVRNTRGSKWLLLSLLSRGADPHLADWPLFLHAFCTDGDMNLIKTFFGNDGEVDPRLRIDARDGEGNTPLHLALHNGHVNIAKLLLKRGGANPSLVNGKGEAPLDIVLGKKRETLKQWERIDDLTIVAKMIFDITDASDRTMQLDTRDKLGNTPLHLTLENDLRSLSHLLLLRGSDPTLVNEAGKTPLDLVCEDRRDDLDLVKTMFEIVDERRLSVNVDSLLQSAVHNGLVKVTKLLLIRGADPTLTNAKGETPLDVMCRDPHDNVDLVRMILKIADEKYRPVNVDDLLQSAVANGNVKVIKLLLQRGASPHTQSSDGSSTLCRMFERFSDATLPRIVSEMIDHATQPMPIDSRDRWGQHDTLLHLALRNGRKKTAALLLRRGAEAINSPNAEGETPLHLYCRRNVVHWAEMFFASMDRRNQAVLLDAQNNRGDTPLHVALSHSTGRRMAELLLGRGADSTLVNEAGETLLHVVCKAAQDSEMAEMLFRICDERGEQVPLDARDAWGNAPLHNLAYSGHDESSTCELLLARGADPNGTNNVGRTPLHIACDGRDFELARTLLNHERLRVDVADQEGDTALHLALDGEHRLLAELLLRRGADPNAAKANGETPLMMICKRGQDDDEVQTFFGICDERQVQVEVNAADDSGNTALKWAVARVLPALVDQLIDRGANASRFVLPADFGASIQERNDRTFDDRLNMACDFLAIVESLERGGHDMERSEALRIMRLFARHGLIAESTAELQHFWRDYRQFANDAKQQSVKKGLTLYELIRAEPRQAAKLVTLKEFRQFARAINWDGAGGRNRACAVYLLDKMSREFFRVWAVGSMMELTHQRLPLECCDMISSELANKDLYNVCLAAAPRTDEDAQQ